MKIAQRIIFRWVANLLGLWIASRLIADITHGDDLWTLAWAALALSVVNSFIKPFVIMLSLPAIVFSLGLFILFINGLMVWITAELVQQFDLGTFEVNGFGAAVLAGLIIGLVNYVVTVFIEKRL